MEWNATFCFVTENTICVFLKVQHHKDEDLLAKCRNAISWSTSLLDVSVLPHSYQRVLQLLVCYQNKEVYALSKYASSLLCTVN